jgi:integrase
MIATTRTAAYATIPRKEGEDLGRKRLQQKGDLWEQGGQWKLRWREDQRDENGDYKYGWTKAVTLGPSEGPGRFTRKQAERIAWDNHLSRIDNVMRQPKSVVTVRQFVKLKFETEHVIILKPTARVHYQTFLAIVLDGVPDKRIRDYRSKEHETVTRRGGIGDIRMRDVTKSDCQKLVSLAIQRDYSVSYATHIKNCISAIFTHAEREEWLEGRNPAKHVRLPENVPVPHEALTFSQLRDVAAALDPQTRAMVLCASLTSMNVAEVCGLKWKYLNLSDEYRVVDGEALAPWQIAVRWQWILGALGTVKKRSRRRLVIVPQMLAEALAALRGTAGPEDFVFSLNGKPVDQRNILRRRLKPIGKALGMPWLGWHSFRRTFATLADQVGMSTGERQALMGHSASSMTAHYTKTPIEQSRPAVEKMAEMVRVKAAVN